MKKEKGITLIALVITIVILLILAGLSISALTGSGLFGKAEWTVKLTKIREIEEAANLAYMERQIDEATKGETTTIAEVISDLKSQGYNIEQRTSGTNTVTGIELNKTNVKMNKASHETLTYTLVYGGEGTVRYFAEIDGKYYEMTFDNGTFKIKTDLEGINKKPKVTATSNSTTIVTAQKTEGKDEIVIASLDEHGETTITIKEENSGTITICNVKVMTLIESITFNQETINLEKGNSVKLSTLITVNPTDATEELIWTKENGEIVEITEEGRLVGVKEGTTAVKVTNEDGTIQKICTVTVKLLKVGDYVNYTPDIPTNTQITVLNSEINTYSGKTGQSLSQTSGMRWRILELDETGTKPKTLISASITNESLVLANANGYNNAVYLLNEACKTLYSKVGVGEARSMTIEDLEVHYNESGKNARDKFSNEGIVYGDTRRCTGSYANYPSIALEENNIGINTTGVKSDGLNRSEQLKNEDGSYKKYTGTKKASNGMTVKQTFYVLNSNLSSMYDTSKPYYNLFHESIDGYYWLASRCVINYKSVGGCHFAVFCAEQSRIKHGALFYSDISGDARTGRLRPLVNLKSNIKVEYDKVAYSEYNIWNIK